MKSNSIARLMSLNLLLSIAAYGQASFQLANHYGSMVDAPVFDAQGIPLAGTNYRAELWGAAVPNLLSPLVNLDAGNRREMAPFITNGYFFSPVSFLVVASIPPQGWAWLQVRAWDARLGATYEDVVVAGQGGYGESLLFQAQGGDPFNQFPIPGPLIGLQSFSLRAVVPEPSTWALLALGGAGFWCALRRWRA